MTETTITTSKLTEEKTKPQEVQPLTKIPGTLTSPIQLRKGTTPESYFKGQSIDSPVIFPSQKDNQLIKYSNSPYRIRKSFTCSEYRLLTN